jgi:UDP-sugar pyrophosphorylase
LKEIYEYSRIKREEKTVLDLLHELNQDHIIAKYNSVTPEEKKNFIIQFNELDKVCRGGIKDYLQRAKILLEASKNKVNNFSDTTIEIPDDIPHIEIGTDEFFELDQLGFNQLKDTVFVLVAGGLGERLGYTGIKIGLQNDLITLRTYIEVYTDFIKAYEDRVRKKEKEKIDKDWYIPFCIMTSGDTHDETISLLKTHNDYGMRPGQISIVKQNKIPAILDNDCHLALEHDKFLIETKPHGHGDIHYLLYTSGKAKQWIKEGKKYMVQFMDTNVLAFNCVPASIGASVKYSYDVNSIVVPRRPKDAIGAICRINRADGTSVVQNVEYNLVDPLLKEKFNGKGDIANESGFCDFPGNLNVLVFKLEPYLKILEETQGLVPEFVNPKYADETRTKFKSPTRLECLMQDVPKLIKNGETVGYTYFDRWFCFSACKNNLKDAIEKLKKNETGESAFTVERDIFKTNERILSEICGKLEVVNTEPENELNIGGCTVKFGPKIIIYPSYAPTISELKEKLQKMKKGIRMTNNSTLILKNDINIEEGIDLDGYLVADKDEKDLLVCKNKKRVVYTLLKVGEGEDHEKLRGYAIMHE